MDGDVEPPQNRFHTMLQRAGVTTDKPLYAVLVTVLSAAEKAQATVLGARGLSPEGERDLVRRITTTVQKEHYKLSRSLSWRNTVALAFGIALTFGAGLGGGWWLHGPNPLLVGVRAGTERCDDRPDGSRLCWLPFYERLPSKPAP